MSDMVKWDPFKQVTRLYEDMDSLFSEFLKMFSQEFHNQKMTNANIALSVSEKDNEVIIAGEIPNAVKDTVDVALRPDSVIVTGQTSLEKQKEGAKEFCWSKFTKMCALPAKVKSEAAKVSFENGKLTIRVPKA